MPKAKTQKLDVQQIINDLFIHLNPREREILTRRYGLQGNDCETLEKIGRSHEITRERVRQIEANSIRKLNKIDNVQRNKTKVDVLGDVINAILTQSAGMMDKGELVQTVLAVHKKVNDIVLEQSMHFLLSHVLKTRFDRVEKNTKLVDGWKMKTVDLAFMEELVDNLINLVKAEKEPMTGEKLIKVFQSSDFYKKNEAHIMELCDLNKDNKLTIDEIVIAYLTASQSIKQNLFDHWGLTDWKIISPKTINDKIYLILKKEEKPLHYKEIAVLINEVAFDKKTACAATVHNELIIDPKYVLVGRGYYALKEWGYEDGTVEEVIERFLEKAGEPLEKERIMDLVLEKKMVKRSTIYLALLNKKKFKKVEGSKYTLI